MVHRLMCCAALSVLVACQPTQTASTTADPAEVRAAFDSLVAAVVRLDVKATQEAYDTSSATFHTSDGAVLRTRAANDARIGAMFPTLSAIRDASIDSVHFVALGTDAATVVASFRETLVDKAGQAATIRGVWTTLFVRRSNGWKVIGEHVSHLPVAAP